MFAILIFCSLTFAENIEDKDVKHMIVLFNGKTIAGYVDSLEVARNKFPGVSNSLDALCKRFNIDLSKRLKHNALLDLSLIHI